MTQRVNCWYIDVFLVLSVSISHVFDTSRCVKHMSLCACSSGQFEFFFYLFHNSLCTQEKGSMICIPYLWEKHFYGRYTYYVEVERKEQETPPLPFNNLMLIQRWWSLHYPVPAAFPLPNAESLTPHANSELLVLVSWLSLWMWTWWGYSHLGWGLCLVHLHIWAGICIRWGFCCVCWYGVCQGQPAGKGAGVEDGGRLGSCQWCYWPFIKHHGHPWLFVKGGANGSVAICYGGHSWLFINGGDGPLLLFVNHGCG